VFLQKLEHFLHNFVQMIFQHEMASIEELDFDFICGQYPCKSLSARRYKDLVILSPNREDGDRFLTDVFLECRVQVQIVAIWE
jgi:hypothetical protein